MAKTIESRWVLGLVVLVLVGSGCQMAKSSNPLSPVVAGPIAGVVISAPNLLEPGQDWQIHMRDQPLKLMFQNAGTSGQRTLFYTLQIATDAAFQSVIFTRTGLQPAGGPTTTIQLPDALPPGRTYWWRVRAEDGANVGEYSKPISFAAVAVVTLGAPSALSPTGTIEDLTPEFRVRAGSKSGPHDRISYMLQVSNNSAFSSIAATFVVDEAGSETVIARNYSFLNGRTYFWRVNARDTGDSGALSAWSGVQTFRTNEPLPEPPPSAPPSGGGGGGGPAPGGPPGDWASCGSTPGRDLVDCVRDAVYRRSTTENAFDITKRVAWLLRGRSYGLLLKPGGENIITWRGKTVSISRIILPNGKLVKVLSDAGPGGSNAASWQECSDKNDLECFVESNRWIPAMDPNLP